MTINGDRYFTYTTGIFRIEHHKGCLLYKNGHAVHIMCDKMWEMWDMFPLRQSFHPSNFGDNTIQVRTNTMRFPTKHP